MTPADALFPAGDRFLRPKPVTSGENRIVSGGAA
jgi:hypothetical protein